MKKVCVNCKWFKSSPTPIDNITANGVCENKKWKLQPIVLGAKTDTCFLFESNKNNQADKESYTALLHLTRYTEFYSNLNRFIAMLESCDRNRMKIALALGYTIEQRIMTDKSYAPKAIRKQFKKIYKK